MKFSRIKLYNLPIDRDYRQVFDIIGTSFTNYTKDEFNSILVNKFFDYIKYEYYQIDTNTYKSINLSSNKTGVITFDQSDLDINLYNYIVLLDGSKIVFIGFIDNFNTIGNSTHSLNIRYDVWTNNLYWISTNQYNTIDNLTLDADNIVNTYCIMNKGHIPNTYIIDNKVYPFVDYNEFENIDKKLNNVSYVKSVSECLFLKLILTEQVIDGTLPYIGSLTTCFFPIAINSLGTFHRLVCTNGTKTFVTTIENNVPNIETILNSSFSSISNYIISAKLTYNVPFEYIIKSSTSEDITGYTIAPLNRDGTEMDINTDYDFIDINTSSETVISTPPLIKVKSFTSLIIEKDFELTTNESYNVDTLSISKKRSKYSDSAFKVFPMYYNRLSIGTYSKILKNNSYYNKAIIKLNYQSDTMGVKVFNKNSKNSELFIDDKAFTRICDTRDVSFSKDSYQAYLASGGAEAQQIFLSNTIASGIQTLGRATVTGGANAIALGASFAFKTNANTLGLVSEMRSADRKSDSAMYTNNRAEIDMEFCDRCIIENITFDKNNTIYINMDNEIYFYGYNNNYMLNPFVPNKVRFDYIKCIDVVIQEKIDTFDKNVLTQILLNGTTKNHIIYKNGSIIDGGYNNLAYRDRDNYDYYIFETQFNSQGDN